MPRAIWTGAVSFGLVNVPVRLQTAVAQKEVHFHMMHKTDGGRIQFKRVCSIDGKEVPYDDIVKGYEVSKGRYVTIDPDELEKLDPKVTHSIDIEDFVQADEIDPIFYDTPYYLAPDQRGGKAYGMLVRAMQHAGRVAIARMVLRTRRSLCALRPRDGILLLSTMNYADEIVSTKSLDIPKVASAPSEREMQMAMQLIDSLTTKFDPEKYHDDYRERVLQLIESKEEGRQIVTPAASERAEVGNLADALAASLANARRAAEPAGESRPRIARRARARRPAARSRTARS